MSIALRSYAQNNSGAAASSSIGVTKPTGLQVGDLLLLWAACGSNRTFTLPSGFTSLAAASGTYASCNLAYKVADAGDVAASGFTVSLSSATYKIHVILAAFSGVDTTTPVRSAYMYAKYINSLTTDHSIVMSSPIYTDEDVIVSLQYANDVASFSGYAAEPSDVNPSSWTEATEDVSDSAVAALAYGAVASQLPGVVYKAGGDCSAAKRGCAGGVVLVPAGVDPPSPMGVASGVSDAYVYSYSATYADARDGTGSRYLVADTTCWAGQRLSSGTYYLYEGFCTFDLSVIPAGSVVTAAALKMYVTYDGSATNFTLRAREYEWGDEATTDDYVAGDDLSAQTLLASYTIVSALSGWYELTSEAALITAVNDALESGRIQMLLHSDRLEDGDAPTGNEYLVLGSGDSADPVRLELTWTEASYADDDLAGSHRVMVWSDDDLAGSHGILGLYNEDFSGSHRVLAYTDDDLAGSHGIDMVDEYLAGSHRVMVWSDDDLAGSHQLLNFQNDDLDGSSRIMVYAADDDLAGSHRVMVWSDDDLAGSHQMLVYVDDDLSGAHTLIPTGVPAAPPPLLYVPQLALLLDDENSVPIDLIAEGADPSSVRFSNSVIGGHGRLSVEFPHRPSRLAVNGLHRGMDAALFDRGHKLHQGKVLSVVGEDEGGGGVTTVTIGGPIELADLDRSFEWVWVDTDYSHWFVVGPPLAGAPLRLSRGIGNGYWPDSWDPDAQWETRTDGELFLGTVKGTTYHGDTWYENCARVRIAYMLARRLYSWPTGPYASCGQIMGFAFDLKCNLGEHFELSIGSLASPWSRGEFVDDVEWERHGQGVHAENDTVLTLAPTATCVAIDLWLNRNLDTVAAGEFAQILHPRVLVRPDGPGTRSWSVGDALPRLDQCLTDVMVDPDGLLATEVAAEEIGDPLEQAAVVGPTRSAALEQLAEYDEDADGVGEPLEYGIWDGDGLHDYVAVVRRRQAAPLRRDQWLAIDSDRDDVDVRVEYVDSEAPDYVEVRFAYRKTNLLRHSSPAAAGYWSGRGYADDRPYDWTFTGDVDVVEIGGLRYYRQRNGAQAAFPAAGSYPIPSTDYGDFIPMLGSTPLRFQIWGKLAGAWAQVDFVSLGGGGTTNNPIDDEDWPTDDVGLLRVDFWPGAGNALRLTIRQDDDATLWWRNAQLYMMIPDGTPLSVWWPEEPTSADASTQTYELPFPATIWQARNSARKFYNSFARGRGRGTITARGILHDVRGREVPVSRIRGGWWVTILDDPRCTQPLYITGVSDVDPYRLEAELLIGGETPPWSAREPLYERRTYGRYEDWRGFRPLGGRR